MKVCEGRLSVNVTLRVAAADYQRFSGNELLVALGLSFDILPRDSVCLFARRRTPRVSPALLQQSPAQRTADYDFHTWLWNFDISDTESLRTLEMIGGQWAGEACR